LDDVKKRRAKRERRHQRLTWQRRLFGSGMLVVVLMLLFLPVQVRMWRIRGELHQLQAQEQFLAADKSKIQKKIDFYSSDAYVEEAARQNLGLVRPGEAPILPAVPGQTQVEKQIYKD
jgi:cell division protein FtsB